MERSEPAPNVAAPNVAEPPHRSRALRAFAGDVGPKLFITIVAAGITALLIPWINGKWQDHKQQLELRTALAADMSHAYTNVITSERFVAFGLVYSPGSTSEQVATNANAWQTGWHDWLVDAGTLGAQLTARYGVSGLAAEWKAYIAAVAGYIRLGAEIPARDRPQAIAAMKEYLGAGAVDWSGLVYLKKLKRHADFKASYTALGDRLLERGDALVLEELQSSPRV
jgi:hypothetical protein